MSYRIVSLKRCSGTHSEFQVPPDGWVDETYASLGDVLADVAENARAQVVRVDNGGELPGGLENISGRIHCQPAGDIYGWVDESGQPQYFIVAEEATRATRAALTEANGFAAVEFPGTISGEPGMRVIGNATEGSTGDNRVEVSTTDAGGQRWRVFVERGPDGLIVSPAERVAL